MNGMVSIPAWAAMPAALLLVAGGSVILIGTLGLMRLPAFYQCIHGPAVTVTLGAGGVLLAAILYFTELQSRLVMHEVIITFFIFLTAPVVSLLLMREAIYRDLRAGNAGRNQGTDEIYGGLPKK